MTFTEAQTQSLLAVKGIGKTVLQHLQQMGLDDVAELTTADTGEILQQGAALTGLSCWRNSPQTEVAIETVVAWAKAQQNSNP